MDFFLFLIVNAVLFIRPQEIISDFPVANPYVLLIVANLALCGRVVLTKFSAHELRQNPLLVMVIGMLAAIMLSQISHIKPGTAWEGGVDFAKVVLYYALLISVVHTPARLQRFIGVLVIFTSVLCAMALLQYYEFIHIQALESVGDREIDPLTGEEYVLMRLCSTGVFHDPNDLACIVLAASWMCIYMAGDRKLGTLRFLWLTPLILFGDAFSKTHSRGGFIGLVGSLVIMMVGRFGIGRAIPYLSLGLPVLLFLFAGRATSLSATDDTGQDRIRLWSEGFDLLKSSPLFGIGWEEMDEQVGLVAHNSFIHGFVELGIFGGPLFLGLFYWIIHTLYKMTQNSADDDQSEMTRVRPYLLAIVAGYAVCLLTLTRNYVVPTYMIIGLAGAYFGILKNQSQRLISACDLRLVYRIYVIGIGFLIIANVFTRLLVRHS